MRKKYKAIQNKQEIITETVKDYLHELAKNVANEKKIINEKNANRGMIESGHHKTEIFEMVSKLLIKSLDNVQIDIQTKITELNNNFTENDIKFLDEHCKNMYTKAINSLISNIDIDKSSKNEYINKHKRNLELQISSKCENHTKKLRIDNLLYKDEKSIIIAKKSNLIGIIALITSIISAIYSFLK